MMARARKFSDAVLAPNLGLYLDRPAFTVPLRGLSSCNNIRITKGKISNLNLGWEAFGSFNPLNGPVKLIRNWFLTSGAQLLVFGTTKDLYKYVEGDGSVDFLSPRYEAGTANPTNGSAVVIGGTSWDANLKIGDQMFFGSIGQTDPDATGNGGWYEILTVDSAAQVTLTANYTGTGGAQAYTARQLFTGDIFDRWTGDVFYNAQPSGDDLLFLTNGVDDVVKWDGTATQVTVLTGLNFTCKVIRSYRNMLLYANITEDAGDVKPNTIKNSEVATPEDLASGLAGEFIVKDGEDGISEVATLGDDLAIYADRTGVLAQFVGDPLVFIFRTAFRGLGPLSGGLVADYGNRHEFIGADNAYTFDGVTAEPVHTQVVREVVRTRDPGRIDVSFHHFDEENGDLVWVLPLTTDANTSTQNTPRTGWPVHYLEDVGENPAPWTRRDMPFTASGYFSRQTTLTWDQISDAWQDMDFAWNDQFFSAAFPFNLVGDENGAVLQINTTSIQREAYQANAVLFDGDYLTRGADLTGSADSKLWSGSFWVARAGASGQGETIYDTVQTRAFIEFDTGDRLHFGARNSAGSTILDWQTSAIADTNWHHVVFSFDMADQANSHVYVDDVVDDDAAPLHDDDTIDFTQTNHAIGAEPTGVGKLEGCLADAWIAPGVYIDLSIKANRRKFISEGRTPVNLGVSGELPTGTAPLMLFSGPTVDWHTNKGTGGGFTENGTLTDCASAPPSAAGARSFARFGRRPLGDGRRRNLVARLYPFAKEFPGSSNYKLDVTLHLADHASGPTTLAGPFEFDLTLPEGLHFVSPFRRARYVEVEFGTSAASPAELWELEGYDIDVLAGGAR